MRFHGLKPLSAAVALLWLSAPVASVLHGAASRHSHHYCDEHAAFEEGPLVGEGGALKQVDGPPAGRSGDRDPDAAEHHETCALANLGHLAKQVRTECRTLALGASVEVRGVLAAPVESHFVCAAPLTVAPKTDPPRA